LNILKNKNVFITGASGGIGKELCLQFAEQGCKVFFTGRNKDKIIELEKEFDKRGYDYNFGFVDLTRSDRIHSFIKLVRETMINIDILVNCAGLFLAKNLEKTEEEVFDNIFNVNVKAPFLFTRDFSKDMISNKWGRIINIGSSSAYNGFKDTSLYCASKHALLGFSRAIHNELKEHNIRTFCFSPGGVQTEMGKLVKGQDYSTFIEPDEFARYVIETIKYDSNMISEEVRVNRMVVQ